MNIKKRFFKNLIIQNILGLIVSIYIYIVKITSNINYKNISIPENFWNNDQPFILAFWHSQLMMVSFSWKTQKKINILASGHSDGRFGAIVGKYFNLNNIPTYDKNKNILLRQIFNLLHQRKYIGIRLKIVLRFSGSLFVHIILTGLYIFHKRTSVSSFIIFLLTLILSLIVTFLLGCSQHAPLIKTFLFSINFSASRLEQIPAFEIYFAILIYYELLLQNLLLKDYLR